MRVFRLLLCLLCAISLGGCLTTGGDPTQPIPTAYQPAPTPARRLVVVLPGRGDDLDSLQQRDIARLVQAAWPDADVVTTGLTMPYYLADQAVTRLHDEVIRPARARGLREIWLLGISLGGTGALLYERAHPGELAGLLLLSPYLGDAAINAQIRAAGGLAHWQPGPQQAMGRESFQREIWRAPLRWAHEPARARAVWLGYGDNEPFRGPAEQLAPVLPPGHVLMLPGRHDWDLWTRATTALLARADGATTAPGARGAAPAH